MSRPLAHRHATPAPFHRPTSTSTTTTRDRTTTLQDQESKSSQKPRTTKRLQRIPRVSLLGRADRRRGPRGAGAVPPRCRRSSRRRDLAGLEERTLGQHALCRAVVRAVEPDLVRIVDGQATRRLHHVFQVGGRDVRGDGRGGDGRHQVGGTGGGRDDQCDFRDRFRVLRGVSDPGYGLRDGEVD
jgi:hypothetical protein